MRRLVLRDLPLTVAPGAGQDPASQLAALRAEVEACRRCDLSRTRTQAVFGEGDAHAALMFVGEAPGYNEDKQGRPFVGAAGKLLSELLGSIGLTRDEVFIANVLKSRPPDNRNPRPDEIEACKPYLMRQIALIRPAVICSLGNFATKLLSGSQSGITRVHGVPQLRQVEGHRFYLYPIFHPAAALYTPAMLQTLKADFFRLPQLMATPPPHDEPAQLLGADALDAAADTALCGPAAADSPGQTAADTAARGTAEAAGQTDPAAGPIAVSGEPAAGRPDTLPGSASDGRGIAPEASDAVQLDLF